MYVELCINVIVPPVQTDGNIILGPQFAFVNSAEVSMRFRTNQMGISQSYVF